MKVYVTSLEKIRVLFVQLGNTKNIQIIVYKYKTRFLCFLFCTFSFLPETPSYFFFFLVSRLSKQFRWPMIFEVRYSAKLPRLVIYQHFKYYVKIPIPFLLSSFPHFLLLRSSTYLLRISDRTCTVSKVSMHRYKNISVRCIIGIPTVYLHVQCDIVITALMRDE